MKQKITRYNQSATSSICNRRYQSHCMGSKFFRSNTRVDAINANNAPPQLEVLTWTM